MRRRVGGCGRWGRCETLPFPLPVPCTPVQQRECARAGCVCTAWLCCSRAVVVLRAPKPDRSLPRVLAATLGVRLPPPQRRPLRGGVCSRPGPCVPLAAAHLPPTPWQPARGPAPARPHCCRPGRGPLRARASGDGGSWGGHWRRAARSPVGGGGCSAAAAAAAAGAGGAHAGCAAGGARSTCGHRAAVQGGAALAGGVVEVTQRQRPGVRGSCSTATPGVVPSFPKFQTDE
jgi:hypothetical protein